MTCLHVKQALEAANLTTKEFRDIICDILYRESETIARLMHIAVHPYLTGLPYRIGALDAALQHICGHSGVWLATGSEIAAHYRSVASAMKA